MISSRRRRSTWTAWSLGLLLAAVCPQAVLAAEFADVMAAIEKYYLSQEQQDIEGFLATQLPLTGAEEETTRLLTGAAWEQTGIGEIVVGPAEVAINPGQSEALVRFQVGYTVSLKQGGESFRRIEQNAAIVVKQGGWKIRRLSSQADFERIPQAVDEGSYERLARDRDLYAQLTRPSGLEQTAPPALPPQDVVSGLLLSYDFTNTAGDKPVEDLSGNGYGGKLNGPVGRGRNGLYFNGQGDYIEVEGGERLHSDEALTVTGEFIPISYANKTWQNLVWKGNAPDCTRDCENREFSVWLHGSAYLHATSTAKDGVGRGQTFTNTPGGSVTGRTVFAQVIDSAAQSMQIFINGKAAASRSYSSSGLRRTEGPLLIGGGWPLDTKSHFRGYLLWLRIYDRALTDEEIAATSRRKKTEKEEPWRDPYLLDDTVVKGGWATTSPIQDDPFFAKFDLGKMEPGIVVRDGWFSHPANGQATEIVFRHDGSPLRLAGHATIIDCLDRCGSAGQVEQIVRGDGKDLWHSGQIAQKGPGKDFDVDLTGVREVRLVTTDGGNGAREDWAAWLNLKLSVPEEEIAGAPTPAVVGVPEPSPGGKGTIDTVYALVEKPSGSGVASVERFGSAVDQVYVWFTYSNLNPGTIIKGVWLDEGRTTPLQEFPVVITRESGDAGFAVRRPLDGWVYGRYRIDLMSGESTAGTVTFQITR